MDNDLLKFVERHMDFVVEKFGPNRSYVGVLDHMRKEIEEIEEQPYDINEWCDIIFLALSGAMGCDIDAEGVVDALLTKQEIISNRIYPDWRTSDQNKAIEHIRDEGD